MKITNSKKGFTIIEVVLVLAIAGMIFLVVFLAVPQLQESRRDTQRRSDVARIMSQLESYASNNNGNYPDEDCAAGGDIPTFEDNYLEDNTFVSPSGGTYALVCGGGNQDIDEGSDTEDVAYAKGALCDGETSDTAGANSRNVTLQIELEGGGVFCVDNS